MTNAIRVWDEALPLGNGSLGALIWGDGQPLKISLDRTDLWDLTPVPEFQSTSTNYDYSTMVRWHEDGRHSDLVKLYERPYNRPAPTKIPAGRIEVHFGTNEPVATMALDVADARARVAFGSGAQFESFVHAAEPVGMMRIQRAASGPRIVLRPPPFGGAVRQAASGGIGAGDLAQLGYPAAELEETDNAQVFVQRGAGGFEFAVRVGWQVRGGVTVAAWSVASSAEGPDPGRRARVRVDTALSAGFEVMLASHAAWWRRYWGQSGVRVPNAAVERQYYLDQYKFGAASRRGAPPITLQGPWTADDGQLPPWKGDYHHDLNTQLSYWPCYAGNHLEEGLSYLDWLWATRSNCLAWTRQFFKLPGLNVPMTADLANRQIGGWRQYTHSATTAAWLAQHFYWHWRFSADREFLRARAWPYLRDASVFIEAISERRDSAGRRTLRLSSSPEIHDNRPEAWFKQLTNYDLALMRWLLGATAELADELGLADEAVRWRRVRGELPELAVGEQGQLLVAPGAPLRESHRHFSHLMALHPLGLIDGADGAEARRTVDASMLELERIGTSAWCGYSFAWLASLAARAGNGAKAERALEIFATAFTLPNSFHANGDQSNRGYSSFRYRPFTLEGNFAAAAGLQEMLVQSHRGHVDVFPAIPASWRNVQFESLRAQGAFLVSAERRDGTVRRVAAVSEAGGVFRLRSPWSGREIRVETRRGQRFEWRQDPPDLKPMSAGSNREK